MGIRHQTDFMHFKQLDFFFKERRGRTLPLVVFCEANLYPISSVSLQMPKCGETRWGDFKWGWHFASIPQGIDSCWKACAALFNSYCEAGAGGGWRFLTLRLDLRAATRVWHLDETRCSHYQKCWHSDNGIRLRLELNTEHQNQLKKKLSITWSGN